MRKLDMNKFLVFLSVLALLSVFAYSIGTNEVVLNAPDNGTWTQDSKYAPGFNVTWDDVDEDILTADCTLYINTSATGLTNNPSNGFGTISVANNTETNISMNKTFPTNNTKYFWTIECVNSSATPTSWYPAARVIYNDNTTPTVTEINRSFLNNTWGTTATIEWNVTVTDNMELDGDVISCSIVNTSNGYKFANSTGINGTNITLSFNSIDQNTTVTINCTDPALNNDGITATTYVLLVDATATVFTFVDSSGAALVNKTYNPPDGNITSSTELNLNISITERFLESVSLNLSGTLEPLNLSTNCTSSVNDLRYCWVNKTGLSANRNISYSFVANDSAGAEFHSETRTITIDTEVSTIVTVSTLAVADSIVTWEFNFTDFSPKNCEARIFNESTTENISSKINITGTIYRIGDTENNICNGTLDSSQYSDESLFHIQYYVADNVGSTNLSSTNTSGVFTNLYTGWNLVNYGDNDITTLALCDRVKNCTQISKYNNSDRAFDTFSTSTPGTNNATNINRSDAVFIFTTADDSLWVNDFMYNPGEGKEFTKLYAPGWNVLGLLRDTNVSDILEMTNQTNSSNGVTNVTLASWYSTNTETYNTCRRSIDLCAGGTSDPADIQLKAGYGVWVLINVSGPWSVNRSMIGEGLWD